MEARPPQQDPTASASKPRLLVLASTFPRWAGDTEPTFVFELSRRLTDSFDVHVLAPHAPGAARQEVMAGMTIHRFRYAPTSWQSLTYDGGILSRLRQNRWRRLLVPGFVLAEAWAIRRLLRRNPFHAIHSHWIIPQTLALRLATIGMRQRPRMLCTSHGGDLFGLQGRFMHRLKRWALARCNAMTVVSQAMVPEAQKLAAHLSPQVIPMGTDLAERFTPDADTPRDPNRILFVGRLVEKKGVDHLLDALARVIPKHPDLMLVIAGKGPMEPELRARATKPDLAGHVTFLGPLPHDQLPEQYRRAAITVVPSTVPEGFGLVIVEAMGCGCPVIVSDLPAVRDIVGEEQLAITVPPGDVPALAAAIEQAVTDPEAAQAQAQQALAQVRARFDWASIGRAYRGILKHAGSRRAH